MVKGQAYFLYPKIFPSSLMISPNYTSYENMCQGAFSCFLIQSDHSGGWKTVSLSSVYFNFSDRWSLQMRAVQLSFFLCDLLFVSFAHFFLLSWWACLIYCIFLSFHLPFHVIYDICLFLQKLLIFISSLWTLSFRFCHRNILYFLGIRV